MHTTSLFIDGEWLENKPTPYQEIYNPATGEVITSVQVGGEHETKLAVAAATRAFSKWKQQTGRERGQLLAQAAQLMQERADHLARVLTLEQGKPFLEARGEVIGAAQFLQWYAEEASRAYGEWIPSSVKGKKLLVVPEPIGVVGAITPWNFPSSMITRKIGPALAAGCTVVLKPAPETPLSAIEIVKIFEEVGCPNGVLNLVTGDAQAIGQVLLTSKEVRMITFTGSTAVGKYLMRESAHQVKKLSLELGGHAPILVCEDADLEKAARLTVASKFRNNGQTCICANRIYVHEAILEPFSKQLLDVVAQLKVGNGLDEQVTIGPLINELAVTKVEQQLSDAVTKGAKMITGGQRLEHLEGHFFAPTVLTGVTNDMQVMKEETFGPLLPLQAFSSIDDVIALANDTDYGLAAYVFTESTSTAFYVSEQLEYGMVGVNDVFPSLPETPFGGIKQSGIGKEGGHYGMAEFLEEKLISISV